MKKKQIVIAAVITAATGIGVAVFAVYHHSRVQRGHFCGYMDGYDAGYEDGASGDVSCYETGFWDGFQIGQRGMDKTGRMAHEHE